MGGVIEEKKVALCKEVDIVDKRIIYYPIDESMEDIFAAGTYLFRERMTEGEKIISAIYVEDILFISQEKEVEDITGLCFREVDSKYVFPLGEEAVLEYKRADVNRFKKILKQTLTELKFLLESNRFLIDEDRKRYLIDTYFGVPENFEKNKETTKYKWLQEVNGNELALYYEINVRELKRKIELFINCNCVITNVDKIALRCYCFEKLEHVFYAIEPKNNARMQMNDYIGVHVDDKNKDLIWGYRTAYPIRLGFSFFWGLFRNILSLTYVPAVFLLLDKDYKIPIYIMLSIVYLIALVFSDEKQMDKLLCNTPKNINYEALYYSGLMVSVTFILFSIEMVITPSNKACVIVQYLLVGVVVAYAIILLLNGLLAIWCWIITICRATRFYRKKWKKVKHIVGNAIKTVIYFLGVASLADILEVYEYMGNNAELSWKFWVFFWVFMTSVLRIIALWLDARWKAE